MVMDVEVKNRKQPEKYWKILDYSCAYLTVGPFKKIAQGSLI